MARFFYGDVESSHFCRLIFRYFPVVILRFFASAVFFDAVAFRFFLGLRFRVFLRFLPVLIVSVFCTTSSYDIELRTVEKGLNQAF